MKVYRSKVLLRKDVGLLKRKGRVIGLVPTMGFLHEGHLSLIRKARKDSDCVVVSIFVNPAQFGPKEDFKKYPRDLKKDLALCQCSGVDMVFVPDLKSMYPEGFSAYVNVEGLTKGLCGASRPWHFRGVTTIVTKLFNIVSPDIAYFGQKDAQQAVVIKKMARDLDMPVRIKVMPIARERDGLAMSSRNAYLNPAERSQAPALYKSLRLARDLYKRKERDPEKIIAGMRKLIEREKHARIEYISIVDPETLVGVKRISGKTLVALAVRIGKTRLIDNVVLN
ncbi:MAG: pantoate--beta-alanine ligase [Candidatus Omnitrophica bacterium]|nr:pantoate--beta-alanine ligase [Candidatus Omnitrophota bacterium]MBU4149721.1 pantoate--beta-alanine ligase [Candidatus Omnitrophota bacterium]